MYINFWLVHKTQIIFSSTQYTLYDSIWFLYCLFWKMISNSWPFESINHLGSYSIWVILHAEQFIESWNHVMINAAIDFSHLTKSNSNSLWFFSLEWQKWPPKTFSPPPDCPHRTTWCQFPRPIQGCHPMDMSFHPNTGSHTSR